MKSSSYLELSNMECDIVSNDRKYKRVEVNAIGDSINLMHGGGQFVTCRLIDISVGGVKFSSVNSYRVGDIVMIRTDIIKESKNHPMKCKICRVEGAGRASYIYSGKFIDLSKGSEKEISELVKCKSA